MYSSSAALNLYHNSHHTRSQDLNRYERLQAHTMCSPLLFSPETFEHGTLFLRLSYRPKPLHLLNIMCIVLILNHIVSVVFCLVL